MPCDTVRNVTLNLHVADKKALMEALKELGYQPEERYGSISFWVNGQYCQISADKLTIPQRMENREGIVNQIKRQTSHEIVKRIAARQNWNIKKVSENKYKVVRRY